ncbi:MAG: dihydropteroate synthase [Marinilabiliaceae bacterium]
MQIIGELINASRKKVRQDIQDQNADNIAQLAKEQREAGADFIDVNAGIFVGKETEYVKWLVETVQGTVDAPCCIDSPDPKVIEEALKLHKGVPMINSISLESDRYENLLPIVRDNDVKVIALCMSDEGMPYTKDARLKIADKLINNLVKNNVPIENIYVDPLVHPIGSGDTLGMEALNSIEAIMKEYEGVHTACGLSNISYGIPKRQFVNQVFMNMAIAKGLDSAILNPLDKKMMANIIAGEMLAGKDEFCANYMDAYRNGLIE